MAIKRKVEFSPEEIETGLLILTDPIGFLLHFWRAETTIPAERSDLPDRWRGRQVLTQEQVIMATAGFLYVLFGEEAKKIQKDVPQRVLARTARKTGKTLIGFERLYIQIALLHTKDTTVEGLYHAPSDVHMAPVVSRIDEKVNKTPLFSLLHDRRNMDSGIDIWKNGFRWHRRIEGLPAMGGKNMVGLRAAFVLGDEGDYSSKGAYDERRQTALPTAWEFWGGVPRDGVRSNFYMVAKGRDPSWFRLVQGQWSQPWRWDIRANPLFHSNAAFREQLAGDPWSHPRVMTQVLGMDGEEGVSTFSVIPKVYAPWFRFVQVADDELIENPEMIISALSFDLVPSSAIDWMIHSDYGFSPSPMVVGVSFLDSNTLCWTEFARIVMYRAHAPAAAKFLNLLDTSLPKRARLIVLDAHGRGAGVYEILHKTPEYQKFGYGERLISAEFHTTLDDSRVMVHAPCRYVVSQQKHDIAGKVYFCPRCRVPVSDDDVRPRRVRAKQLLTELMDNMFRAGAALLEQREAEALYGIVLANEDTELYTELRGTKGIPRGDRTQMVYTNVLGENHNTDAWLCLTRGITYLVDKTKEDEEGEELGEWGFFDM